MRIPLDGYHSKPTSHPHIVTTGLVVSGFKVTFHQSVYTTMRLWNAWIRHYGGLPRFWIHMAYMIVPNRDSLNSYIRLDTYWEGWLEFEKFIDAEDFKKISRDEYYILLETTRDNWKKLVEYSISHDRAKGEGDEYCFKNNGYWIQAVTRDGFQKFMLYPGTKEYPGLESYFYPDNTMLILWEIPNTKRWRHMDKEDVWTARRTHDWILNIIGNK